MKKFKFTLQSALGFKENIEENEKTILLNLNSQMNILQDDISFLKKLHTEYAARINAMSAAGVMAADLIQFSLYLREIETRQKQKQSEADKLQKRIDMQTKVLVKASTEVKTLNKLKEVQYGIYKKIENKENERLIEEFICAKA